MAGLRDQLLKSGLVNEKRVKQAQKEQRKDQRQKQQQGKSAPALDEARLRQQQIQAEKLERDRRLNQERQDAAEKKALCAQARQIIEVHRLARSEGETPFSFIDAGKVKKLYLDGKQRDQLVQGQLAIVKLDQRYELVPRETAEKIRQRDGSLIILLNEPSGQVQPVVDDPYAGFAVPDDLIW